jgi:hypothetical protein
MRQVEEAVAAAVKHGGNEGTLRADFEALASGPARAALKVRARIGLWHKAKVVSQMQTPAFPVSAMLFAVAQDVPPFCCIEASKESLRVCMTACSWQALCFAGPQGLKPKPLTEHILAHNYMPSWQGATTTASSKSGNVSSALASKKAEKWV